jgi:hypothetical protein
MVRRAVSATSPAGPTTRPSTGSSATSAPRRAWRRSTSPTGCGCGTPPAIASCSTTRPSRRSGTA